MRVTLGRIVVDALRRKDDAVTHAVLDAINTLMQPMHDQPDIRQEQLNKSSIMSSEAFMSRLVDIFTLHAVSRPTFLRQFLLFFLTSPTNQPFQLADNWMCGVT